MAKSVTHTTALALTMWLVACAQGAGLPDLGESILPGTGSGQDAGTAVEPASPAEQGPAAGTGPVAGTGAEDPMVEQMQEPGVEEVDSGMTDAAMACASNPSILRTDPDCFCSGDTDGDGTIDCDDQCPLDTDRTEPGPCGCGQADTDMDGDDTLDCNDGCPLDPLKMGPGVCGCGVRDKDSDSDGSPDCVDSCPLDATDNAVSRAVTAIPGDDCTWQTHCSHGYWVCTSNETWLDARSLCTAVGGDLASINNQQEQDFIRVHATGSVTEWLVGLNRINASGVNGPGVWEWVDGSLPMDGYDNWDVGEPDNDECGSLHDDEWIDWPCNNVENWICEVP